MSQFEQIVINDTWGRGLPMIYMNREGQIVKHWKDGTIEVIEPTKKNEPDPDEEPFEDDGAYADDYDE